MTARPDPGTGPTHTDPTGTETTEGSPAAPPPANRAERRARARGRSPRPLPESTGKVQPVRFDHATDPRQFAAHRRG